MMVNNRFSSKPNWLHISKVMWHMSLVERRWLLDRGSLTSRLIDISNNSLEVTIIRQQMCRPYLSEAGLLEIPIRQQAIIREVILSDGKTPLVFARSVIPIKTLTGRLRNLSNMGSKPLGSVLFKDPSMRRGKIEIARVMPQHNYVPDSMLIDKYLLGRRSSFYLDNKPLLVSEVFLDTFPPFKP